MAIFWLSESRKFRVIDQYSGRNAAATRLVHEARAGFVGLTAQSLATVPLAHRAVIAPVFENRRASLGMLAGIRLMAHKEARVAFHDPLKILEAAMGGRGSPTQMAVMNILSHYIRYEV
jgi:hypothetical protein